MSNLTWAEVTELNKALTIISDVSNQIAQMAEARPWYVIEADNLKAVHRLLLVVLGRVMDIVQAHEGIEMSFTKVEESSTDLYKEVSV
jgi:hypothetical protein